MISQARFLKTVHGKHTHTHVHNAHTHTYTLTHIHTHTHAHTHTHTHTQYKNCEAKLDEMGVTKEEDRNGKAVCT